jgi:2-keto-4-pentenoate hydratase/2-oxohepta-3-ene-1,7-dioic acid hydratase in catechol pathway
MRLAHFEVGGEPRLAIAGPDGWVDVATATGDESLDRLSAVIDGGSDAIARAGQAAAAGGVAPLAPADAEPTGPLLDEPRRVFCVGRNYVAHRDEFNNRPSEWPEVFLRLPTTVTGPFSDVTVPAVSERFDFEGEMGVVIGSGGRNIPAAAAEDHILGFCVVNDLTAREWQHRGGQWTAGKNFDATLPAGPALVTPDELDWHDAAIRTVVSGEEMQSSRTSLLIFSVAEQIEFISTWTELRPGDLIATGTPGGVGIARRPPRVLAPGDIVEVTVQGVGTIRNRIVADTGVPASDRWLTLAAESTVGRT